MGSFSFLTSPSDIGVGVCVIKKNKIIYFNTYNNNNTSSHITIMIIK